MIQNILFTCAGRRNYLINYFKEAINGNGKIIAVDTEITAPALADADISIKVPKINDPSYITVLQQIIKDQNVTALISLNDLELPILSKNKDELELFGVKVIISNENIIDIAFDKWKSYNFFKSININTPKTYLTIADALNAIKINELTFPLIVKPRFGSASIGIDQVDSEEELLLSYKLQTLKILKTILKDVSAANSERSIIIQEKIDGNEYGVDILNDFNGNYFGSFVRKKLSMRSGETDKAVSVINSKFNKIAKIIGDNTGHIGNMDCDFFVKNDEVYFLEMNPRFGGGYPFSHEAGINTASIYLSWLNNEFDVNKFNNFKADLTFSKYDSIMFLPK